MTLYTLSGIAGSGKTERLIGYAALRLKCQRKTVFVCRSKELCNQTRLRLIATGIHQGKITLIYSQRRNAKASRRRAENATLALPGDQQRQIIFRI